MVGWAEVIVDGTAEFITKRAGKAGCGDEECIDAGFNSLGTGLCGKSEETKIIELPGDCGKERDRFGCVVAVLEEEHWVDSHIAKEGPPDKGCGRQLSREEEKDQCADD